MIVLVLLVMEYIPRVILAEYGCESHRAEDPNFKACGEESLPRHEQGTGSTGTESALILLLMNRQEWILLVKR